METRTFYYRIIMLKLPPLKAETYVRLNGRNASVTLVAMLTCRSDVRSRIRLLQLIIGVCFNFSYLP